MRLHITSPVTARPSEHQTDFHHLKAGQGKSPGQPKSRKLAQKDPPEPESESDGLPSSVPKGYSSPNRERAPSRAVLARGPSNSPTQK
jgi:hypothetical protein